MHNIEQKTVSSAVKNIGFNIISKILSDSKIVRDFIEHDNCHVDSDGYNDCGHSDSFFK